MAVMPQEAIQQGSTQPETTKPDKYSISTAEALREGYSVPEPVPETVSCKYCGRVARSVVHAARRRTSGKTGTQRKRLARQLRQNRKPGRKKCNGSAA